MINGYDKKKNWSSKYITYYMCDTYVQYVNIMWWGIECCSIKLNIFK